MSFVNWNKLAAITVSVAGGVALLYLLGRYVIALLLPFLIAFLLALITRPAVLRISRRTGWPLGWTAALVTLVTLVFLGGICCFAISRLLHELQRLILFLLEDGGDPSGKLADFGRSLGAALDRIPLVARLRQEVELQHFAVDPQSLLKEQLQHIFTRVSERMTSVAADLLRRLPSVLFFFLVTLISCFYFSVDYERICRGLARLLPERFAAAFPAWRRRVQDAILRFLRAYALLFLLTFAELLLGLFILRVEYVLLLALVTAALDVLPVLGVGVVLVPYALFSLATGDVFRGVGLLVLYGLVTVVRQVAEPHLIGKSFGLHPIPVLISFYVGLKLFGFAGVLVGPGAALLIKAFLDERSRVEDSA